MSKKLNAATAATVFVLGLGVVGLGAGVANAAPSGPLPLHHGNGGGGCGNCGNYGNYGVPVDPITAGFQFGTAIATTVGQIAAIVPPPAPALPPDCINPDTGAHYQTPPGYPC